MSLTPFRDALIAVYDADKTVIKVTGRRKNNLRPRGAQRKLAFLPLLTYFVVSSPQRNGTQGRRNVVVQFEAWVKERNDEDYDGINDLETLMDRAEALFVGKGMTVEGVDISRVRVVNRQDRELNPDNCVRSIRADFLFVVTTT